MLRANVLFRAGPRRTILFAVASVLLGWLLSYVLPGYLVFLGTTAVVAMISLLGLGVVTGSAGMMALCQLSFAAIGAWVVSWLNTAGVPGGLILWLPLGGLAAAVAGLVVGLPALRLRGVNLAVVTLGFAAAADLTLGKIQFPGTLSGVQVPRPAAFYGDRGYLFFSIIVLVLCALLVFFLQKSSWGSAWKSVAFSERGTASAGSSVTVAKLTAFAASAFLAGIGGALLSGQVGLVYPTSFTTIQSLALYVLAIVSGSYLIDMAVLGGILWVLVPELLKKFGISQDWGFVVFGLLGIQSLTTGSNLGEDLRSWWWRRKQRKLPAKLTDKVSVPESSPIPNLTGPSAPVMAVVVDPDSKPLLSVQGLSVTFGQVSALKDVQLSLTAGSITGLMGPNGAGKSTLVDALSGFLPQHEGSISLDGSPLVGLSPVQRSRRGLRRTFQQDRVPPTLTVGAYLRFISRGGSNESEIAEILDFFGCPAPGVQLSRVDVGTRRLIEVAANIAAKPKLLLLDEPAAGLSHEEHLAFGQQLLRVPERFGTSLLVIEHDLDLVRAVCSRLVVLNFGEVIASGDQESVLSDPAVMAAYMGELETT
ncbi:branched-chain amino acid transport system permease protein [Psychromicrobium silvestre]|uniref:Branched-chain amino acid transport system permease protein n=1 Tax=Psychromicrobium silvestre TaxID=1645614 RepID=A0A7Y9S7M7_9MICC|nr:ATP-binding cassette domain-containing protein [Psychromicrobium silvestre]NYE94732.1 branched-chain amino acid transport system permease protein [Psychromicrobium silvestre]